MSSVFYILLFVCLCCISSGKAASVFRLWYGSLCTLLVGGLVVALFGSGMHLVWDQVFGVGFII